MDSIRWPNQRSTFGSKSIALRPRPSLQQPAANKVRSRAPFRLFDLPPELRTQILNLALLDCKEHKHVLQIFLACQRLYTEAADIFYHDIWLDITERTSPPGLLTEPMTPLSPRLHVRTMVLKLYLKHNLRSFNELYVSILREMADQGNLHTLQLEVDGRFPGLDFWTDHWSDDEDFCETEIPLLVGAETKIEYSAPAFVVARPFQTFLDFLSDPRIPKVLLYTASTDHYRFWCLFHRKTSKSGHSCNDGSWCGKSKRLKVNQKYLLKVFHNAQPAQTPKVGASTQPMDDPARIT
ncbi:hypothetical protein HD806DRAFT_312934 [Xylariaceae sp. AK1471]|nr:hypothetical protein HD806DRAFT_312934 [Xylariaceae sp. AK1471]